MPTPPITPWSAQGSHILIGGTPVSLFPVAEARLVDMGRLAEATTSAGILRKKVLSDGQGNFSAPWNNNNDPAADGVAFRQVYPHSRHTTSPAAYVTTTASRSLAGSSRRAPTPRAEPRPTERRACVP